MMDVSLALLPGSRGKPKLFLDIHILKQHERTQTFSASIINLNVHLECAPILVCLLYYAVV